MKKIRRNDEVVVIAGKDKGRRGKILRLCKNGRLVVEGINLIKRHTRPNPMSNQQGGIIEREASIDASNIAIWNPELEKADRVGFVFEDGSKRRIFKSNRNPVDA